MTKKDANAGSNYNSIKLNSSKVDAGVVSVGSNSNRQGVGMAQEVAEDVNPARVSGAGTNQSGSILIEKNGVAGVT
jgi:hypothetical protein